MNADFPLRGLLSTGTEAGDSIRNPRVSRGKSGRKHGGQLALRSRGTLQGALRHSLFLLILRNDARCRVPKVLQ